jgi:hypothetical protein
MTAIRTKSYLKKKGGIYMDNKGKRSKKVLHIFHVLWEFLRKIWTALGETPKGEHAAEHAEHEIASESVSQSTVSSTTSKGVITSGKKTMIKSTALKGGAGLGALGIGAKLGGLFSNTSAAAVGSTGAKGSTTLAGVLISTKTLTIVLISGAILLSGAGIYNFYQSNDINHFSLQNIITIHKQLGDALNKQNTNPNNPLTDTASSSESQQGSSTGNGQSGNTGGSDPPDDSGTDPPSIDYEIP